MDSSVHAICSTLNITQHREWVKQATDAQLDEYIAEIIGHPSLHRLGVAEREKRFMKRALTPHWTLKPAFWISVIILGLTIIGLIIGVLAWLFPQEPKKHQTPIVLPVSANQSTSIYIARPITNEEIARPIGPPQKQVSKPATNAEPTTNDFWDSPSD